MKEAPVFDARGITVVESSSSYDLRIFYYCEGETELENIIPLVSRDCISEDSSREKTSPFFAPFRLHQWIGSNQR
jgi:hypothetical protein